MQIATDILDDPRYDRSPMPMSVVVSRSPSVAYFSRKKMLRLIGLAPNARWESANAVLKQRIIAARRANDLDAAAYWSNIRDELKTKMPHTCGCGLQISAKAVKCSICDKQGQRGRLVPSHLLGTMPDRELARVYGLPNSRVYEARRQRGIPAFRKGAAGQLKPMIPTSGTPEHGHQRD